MRLQQTILFIGAKGTGKSTLAMKTVAAYKKKALIISSNSYDALYKGLPTITPEKIIDYSRHKTKSKVILPFTGEPKLIFSSIRDHFRNGLLFLDDSRYFLKAKLADEVEDILIAQRHFNIDMIIVAHSINKVPISIWPYATAVVLFYTNDSEEMIRREVPNREAIISVMKKLKSEAQNNYHKSYAINLIDNG